MKEWLESARRAAADAVKHHGKFALAIAAPLLVVFGPALYRHMVNSANPLRFNEDVRQQIFPFFSSYDSELFQNDYLADYYRACIPIGYKALYGLGGYIVDPSTISKVLFYVLVVVVAAALAAAARPLAGYAGALFASALVFSNPLFYDRMVGGLPRSFGYPLAALAAALLVHGRVRALAVLVCVGAAFYPAGAMPAGIALALLLFVLPAEDRGEARDWSFARRARTVAFAGVMSALILLPTVIASRSYGHTLHGAADMAAYPEMGPGGRYVEFDRAPFWSFPEDATRYTRLLFVPLGKPFAGAMAKWATSKNPILRDTHGQILEELLVALLVAGCLVLAVKRSEARRLFLVVAAAWTGHLVARHLAPFLYLPQRYAVYPVPVLVTVLLPACAIALTSGLASTNPRKETLRKVLAVLVVAVAVFLPFQGFSDGNKGLSNAPKEAALLEFLGTLPKDSMIAGWPVDLDGVPYVSRRKVLLTFETHQAFHKNFADEMRRRMRRIIEAYYAVDLAPIVRLRDELKVTHFVVRRAYLTSAAKYFKPFTEWSTKAFAQGATRGFELQRQIAAAQVYSDSRFVVLDLKRLRSGAP
jgi:hypothetical protein